MGSIMDAILGKGPSSRSSSNPQRAKRANGKKPSPPAVRVGKGKVRKGKYVK